MSVKNFDYTIGIQTRDLPAYNAVLQLTAPPSAYLCSSFKVRDQVSHPYKTGNIKLPYILIFIFFAITR